MEPHTFTATLEQGHKGCAVVVPFDPRTTWGTPPVALWGGRRGHHARATVNGHTFDSTIVSRSKRSWLLVPDAAIAKARISPGENVTVTVVPRS